MWYSSTPLARYSEHGNGTERKHLILLLRLPQNLLPLRSSCISEDILRIYIIPSTYIPKYIHIYVNIVHTIKINNLFFRALRNRGFLWAVNRINKIRVGGNWIYDRSLVGNENEFIIQLVIISIWGHLHLHTSGFPVLIFTMHYNMFLSRITWHTEYFSEISEASSDTSVPNKNKH